MTFAQGVALGIGGTTIIVIGFIIAYRLGSDNRKKDEEEKQKKRWRKIFSGWD